jgi:outer membrane murein-binding lipoprotein Lpp
MTPDELRAAWHEYPAIVALCDEVERLQREVDRLTLLAELEGKLGRTWQAACQSAETEAVKLHARVTELEQENNQLRREVQTIVANGFPWPGAPDRF